MLELHRNFVLLLNKCKPDRAFILLDIAVPALRNNQREIIVGIGIDPISIFPAASFFAACVEPNKSTAAMVINNNFFIISPFEC